MYSYSLLRLFAEESHVHVSKAEAQSATLTTLLYFYCDTFDLELANLVSAVIFDWRLKGVVTRFSREERFPFQPKRWAVSLFFL